MCAPHRKSVREDTPPLTELRSCAACRAFARPPRFSASSLAHLFSTTHLHRFYIMFSGLLQLVNMVVHKATIHFALFEEIVPLCPIVWIVLNLMPNSQVVRHLFVRVLVGVPLRGDRPLPANHPVGAPLRGDRSPRTRPPTHKYGRGAIGFSFVPLPQLSHAPDFSFPAAPAAAVTSETCPYQRTHR